jgi:hypothetical protein
MTIMNATADSIQIPPRIQTPAEPEFIRLPPPGVRCPFTGLSRSALNELILPTEANGSSPPVRSFCIRKRGAKTGIRLIAYASLKAFIHANAELGNTSN